VDPVNVELGTMKSTAMQGSSQSRDPDWSGTAMTIIIAVGGTMTKRVGVLANLPSELKYLVAPAMKYGIHQTDDERYDFLQCATAKDLEELARVAERIRLNDHNDLVTVFLDKYPITDHAESAKLYFLFGVMDDARLQFLPDNWNTVERHIKQLGRYGSFRLASERAHAAMFLAEFGDKARPAIPHLHRALEDEDLRVRVWSHYALAIIEGHRAEHELAVREIYSHHNHIDELGCHADEVGGEAHAALEKFRELTDPES